MGRRKREAVSAPDEAPPVAATRPVEPPPVRVKPGGPWRVRVERNRDIKLYSNDIYRGHMAMVLLRDAPHAVEVVR